MSIPIGPLTCRRELPWPWHEEISKTYLAFTPIVVPLATFRADSTDNNARSRPCIFCRDDFFENHLIVIHQHHHGEETSKDDNGHGEANSVVDGGTLGEDEGADGPLAGDVLLFAEPKGEREE